MGALECDGDMNSTRGLWTHRQTHTVFSHSGEFPKNILLTRQDNKPHLPRHICCPPDGWWDDENFITKKCWPKSHSARHALTAEKWCFGDWHRGAKCTDLFPPTMHLCLEITSPVTTGFVCLWAGVMLAAEDNNKRLRDRRLHWRFSSEEDTVIPYHGKVMCRPIFHNRAFQGRCPWGSQRISHGRLIDGDVECFRQGLVRSDFNCEATCSQ